MRTLTIGDMLRALVGLSATLPPYQQSFIEAAAVTSKQGSDTSLLSDKEVENIEAIFLERYDV